MPVITLLEFPRVTQELFESVDARLALPWPNEGLISHTFGEAKGVWRITDLWKTVEEFDRYVDLVFIPAMLRHGGPWPSRREVVRVSSPWESHPL